MSDSAPGRPEVGNPDAGDRSTEAGGLGQSGPAPHVSPLRREPAFNIPGVVLGCCLALLGLHAIRLALSAEVDDRLVAALAFLPARITYALHLVPEQLTRSFQTTVGRNAIVAEQIEFLMGDGRLRPWTLATYALLHASWTHVGFNCVWLVAFGSAVARRFAAWRFLALLLVAAVAGAFLQYAANIDSFQLVIGASAAVSGTMGAAVRFMFRPPDEARVGASPAYDRPALTLRQTFSTKLAAVFIVFWFATDVVFGLFPALSGMGDAPVAWQAHIGGFLVGLLLFDVFDPARPAAAPLGPARQGEPQAP